MGELWCGRSRWVLLAVLLGGCQTLVGMQETRQSEAVVGDAGAGPAGGSASATQGGSGATNDAASIEGGRAGAGTGADRMSAPGGAGASTVPAAAGRSGAGGAPGQSTVPPGGSSGTSTLQGQAGDGGNSGSSGQADPAGEGGLSGSSGQAGSDEEPSQAQAGAAGTAGAAGMVGSGGSPDLGQQMVQQNRVFRAKALWPDRLLGICFTLPDRDQLSPEALTEREGFLQHVRVLLESTWQKEADINWIDWADCSEVGSAIRVTVPAEGTSHTELGYPGWYRFRELTLSARASDAEILYTFGRVLGFGHEYDLDYLPGECRRCAADGDCTVGDRNDCLPSGYCGRLSDHESIMAPPDCGGIEPIRRFSAWDIAGARRAYGSKPTGSLLNARGRCAQVFTEGVGHVGTCLGYDYDTFVQRFAASSAESDLLSSSQLSEQRCLQVDTTLDDGIASPIVYATCDPTSVLQDARFTSVRLRAIGGMCVGVTSAEVGVGLETTTCGSGPDLLKDWTLRDDQLRLSATDLCATVENGVGDAGVRVVLAQCGEVPEWQTFRPHEGTIQWGDFCFNASGGYPIPGEPLILWPQCEWGFDNSMFSFSGPVRMVQGERTLAVDSTTGDLRADLCQPGSCEPSLQQWWDYYF